MKILFLGDIVGTSGCEAVKKFLPKKIEENKIDFVIVNGENAAKNGVGSTEEITNSLFDCGVDVITTGNHVWDQKETVQHIEREERLLRPMNMAQLTPGRGFGVYNSINGIALPKEIWITEYDMGLDDNDAFDKPYSNGWPHALYNLYTTLKYMTEVPNIDVLIQNYIVGYSGGYRRSEKVYID